MVAREKDGKPGYLVFAPFITHNHYRSNSGRKSEVTIVVCLGWIPRKHKDRITSDRESIADESVAQDAN
jgi:cytochrome oxidase assembly protein ShyY1